MNKDIYYEEKINEMNEEINKLKEELSELKEKEKKDRDIHSENIFGLYEKISILKCVFCLVAACVFLMQGKMCLVNNYDEPYIIVCFIFSAIFFVSCISPLLYLVIYETCDFIKLIKRVIKRKNK